MKDCLFHGLVTSNSLAKQLNSVQQLISLHILTQFENKMNSFILLRLVQLIAINEHKYNKNAIRTHDKKYVSSVKTFLLTNNLPLQSY